MNTKATIPENRKEELKKVLFDFYGVDEISEVILEEASEIDFKYVFKTFVFLCPQPEWSAGGI